MYHKQAHFCLLTEAMSTHVRLFKGEFIIKQKFNTLINYHQPMQQIVNSRGNPTSAAGLSQMSFSTGGFKARLLNTNQQAVSLTHADSKLYKKHKTIRK